MTPYQIELLMHFRCIHAPFPRMDASQFEVEIGYFEKEDLIEAPANRARPKLTARGEAYVAFLCDMPLPVATWTLPWTPGALATPTEGKT